MYVAGAKIRISPCPANAAEDKKEEIRTFRAWEERTTFAVIKTPDMTKVFTTIARAAVLGTIGLLAGCDLIEYHPYDTRVEGEVDINRRNIERIETACADRDTVRFAVISDTQRWYDETRAAVAAINARDSIDFVIHCGDLADFGLTREFEWMRDELNRLHAPYVCLLGNHDCLGTGADVFRTIYGQPDFAFDAGPAHFLCLNTNAFEYDYSVAIPDFAFIKSDREAVADGITRTVVAMHAQPGSEQFNNNVSELFQAELHKYPGLSFCVCGHDHHTQVEDLFGDGINYYECGAAKGREYLLFTLSTKGMTYEVVRY